MTALFRVALFVSLGWTAVATVHSQVAPASAPPDAKSAPASPQRSTPGNQPASASKDGVANQGSAAKQAHPPASPDSGSGSRLPAPRVVAIEPAPAGFDLQARGQQILAHLSTVIRYYRSSLTPIQKVGEASDELYRDESVTNARQIAIYAFQSARAEAALLNAYQRQQKGEQDQTAEASEAERLQQARADAAKRTEDLKAQQAAINDQLRTARPKQVTALRAQLDQIQGSIELNAAMTEALDKITGMPDLQGRVGLAADIDRLERAVPELADTKARVVPSPLESFNAAKSAGVSSQAQVVFLLLGTRRAIDLSLQETEALHKQTITLRTPLTNIVRGLVRKGQSVAQQEVDDAAATAQTTASNDAAASAAETPAAGVPTRKDFDTMTATFKLLSTAAVPLSQEVITLEQSRANLLAWRTAVDTEYRAVLRSLLLRILVIAIILSVLLVIGEVWRRVTTRYVHDLRRRRQLLGMRRLVIGALSAIVLIFGFVTQFNSLATFAAFITAGLAVGLQTILLSVAAYFFIVGRYGVRVGDRVTVATVTGDVIEVGLVRFYVMELAGNGLELQPTGRVAVFSNAILFQAGTPLYKQLPGTEYAWHELTVKLDPVGNYDHTAKQIQGAVQTIYEGYRAKVEQQHRNVENWMETQIRPPSVEAHVQLAEGGLQLLVRFAVEIRNSSAIDEQVTRAVVSLIEEDQDVKKTISGVPAIRAAVKG